MRVMVTTKEAAELLQVTPATVRALIRRGELEGRRIGRDYRIPRSAMEALIGADLGEDGETPPRAKPGPRQTLRGGQLPLYGLSRARQDAR